MKNLFTIFSWLIMVLGVSAQTTPFTNISVSTNATFFTTITLPSGNTITTSGGRNISNFPWTFGAVTMNGNVVLPGGNSITSTGSFQNAFSGGVFSFQTGLYIQDSSSNSETSFIQTDTSGTLTITTDVLGVGGASGDGTVVLAAQFLNLTPAGHNITITNALSNGTILIRTNGTGSTGGIALSSSNGPIQIGGSTIAFTGQIIPNSGGGIWGTNYDVGSSSIPINEVYASHLAGVVAAGTSPTILAQSPMGTGRSATITGDDMHGYVTLVTGTGTGNGDQATITFGHTYSATPKMIQLWPGNASASIIAGPTAAGGAGCLPLVNTGALTTSGFTIAMNFAFPVSTTYVFYYHVIQ